MVVLISIPKRCHPLPEPSAFPLGFIGSFRSGSFTFQHCWQLFLFLQRSRRDHVFGFHDINISGRVSGSQRSLTGQFFVINTQRSEGSVLTVKFVFFISKVLLVLLSIAVSRITLSKGGSIKLNTSVCVGLSSCLSQQKILVTHNKISLFHLKDGADTPSSARS